MEKRFQEIGYIHKNTGVCYDNVIESTFFRKKFEKKGKSHLEFKDEFAWRELNIQAAKGKYWLPDFD